MNKIDWTLAPAWAKWASRRPSGYIRWHENKPSEHEFHFWDENGRNLDDQNQLFPMLQKRIEIKPSYYFKGEYEVLHIIEAYKIGFTIGNVIKYLARCEYKEQKETDLRKAIEYTDRHLDKYGNIDVIIPEEVVEDIIEGWGIAGNIAKAFRAISRGDLRDAIHYMETELYFSNEQP